MKRLILSPSTVQNDAGLDAVKVRKNQSQSPLPYTNDHVSQRISARDSSPKLTIELFNFRTNHNRRIGEDVMRSTILQQSLFSEIIMTIELFLWCKSQVYAPEELRVIRLSHMGD